MHKKSIYLLLFILSLTVSVVGQSVSGPETLNNYTLSQKRLLVFSAVQFINIITQGNLDQDSVMSIGRHTTHVPFLFSYTTDSDTGISIGADFINDGKITGAENLLNTVKDEKKMQLLINLGKWYLYQPGNNKTDLDSAEHYINLATNMGAYIKDQKLIIKCLVLSAELNYQRGNISESKKIYFGLLSSAQKEGNLETIAMASQHLGRLLNNGDSMKLCYFNTALKLYRQLHLKEEEIEQTWDIANIYMATNRAIMQKYMSRVLELAKTSGFRHLLFIDYILAFDYETIGNPLAALDHADAAYINMKWSGFVEVEPTFLTRLGSVYFLLDKKDVELSYYRKALALRYSCPRIFWYKTLFFIAPQLSFSGNYEAALSILDSITNEFPPTTTWEKMQAFTCKGFCYVGLRNDKLADQNYSSFYKIFTSTPGVDPWNEFMGDIHEIALFYLSRNDLKKGRLYLNLGLSRISKRRDNFSFSEKYFLLFKIDSIKGDYKSALQNHIRYKYYLDLFTNMDQRKKFDELTIRYAAGKKDQNIRLLKQQAVVQQAELTQNKLTRNITIGGLAALVIIIALLFNQYLVKQRTNRAINKKNTALRKLVNEKEWLLKEVHHRVKNNLQTVVSLLELQSENLGDEALSAIHDSQNRIYAMSLIHQKLYQTDKIASINMQPYLMELSNYLQAVYSPELKIHFDMQVEPLELDVSQAIPVGLIVNEAVTNSIKYAFNHSVTNPEISIVLGQNKKEDLKLIIVDNGIGLPLGFDTTGKSGLGFKLMNALAGDIEGKLIVESEKGTVIKVLFNASITFDKRTERPKPEKAYVI